MIRQFNLLLSASLLAAIISACGNSATPGGKVSLLPKNCSIYTNEQLPFTLNGLIPPNAAITWDASAGSIISSPPGLNALFTAPPQPQVVLISVSISSGTPSAQTPITKECIILTKDAPSAATNNIRNPTIPNGPASLSPNSALPTIVISEVMANPCGGVDYKKWNEYVELYNYGDQPVDVYGWWIADIGESGTPDMLVSWTQRNPYVALPSSLTLNSTVIPPKGFALILSPIYAEGSIPYFMPYAIPANTVILTPAESRTLGDDYFSLVGSGQGRDVLVLYQGGPSVIRTVVSTYGSPKLDSYANKIRDDYLDNLPLALHECSSAERIDPLKPDIFDNWREIANGTPGDAPYP
ncbi:MAG: hypothetical protein HKUEN02_06270 [Anaerolineaceae bacterium]|nr:MAG: hypothetical protein HKUEN02_06270 [Anaerolineaceae bacterium]